MTGYRSSRGFTLFELLVATSVFAILSSMAYTSLMQVMNARDQVNVTENRLAEIQLAFLNLERDLQQIARRPIRNRYGTERPVIVGQGEYLLEVTRGGVRNPARVARSLLQRVSYMIEDDNLVRLSWLVLDQAQDSEPARQTILKKIATIDIRFLNQTNEWSNLWPPQSAAAPPGGNLNEMPRAVAVKLEMEDVGAIERIFLMPEA